MCQVGSGFTDVDRAYLYEKLAGNTCERPPPCYKYGYCTKQSGHLAGLHCAVIFLSPFCCFDAGSQNTTRNVLTFGKRQKLCTDVPSDSQAEASCWPPAYPACPSACTCRIRDPLKSVVLEVHADLRLVRSKVGFLSGPFLFMQPYLSGLAGPRLQVYASDYSLCFPRFDRIRCASCASCLTHCLHLLIVLLQASAGMIKML